jgi:LPXTG-motif cell wall-anchored protein
VGPLVGSNNGPAPSELPRTGTPDLGWLLGLVVAGLALGSGLLLRRRTS